MGGHFEERLRLFKVARQQHCYSKNGHKIRSALLIRLVAESFSDCLNEMNFLATTLKWGTHLLISIVDSKLGIVDCYRLRRAGK